MTQYIAVDIGGTQMRAARYPSDSREPEELVRTRTQGAGQTPVERLEQLIASVWPKDESIAAIAVAAPGPLDPYQGVILSAPNIPGWEDLHLREILTERFRVPIALGNDANLAGLGEWRFGAGQGHHHLIYITVSTGIGGGVIIDDRLLLGSHGMAAELGHVTVDVGGPVCGCGQRGHLEALASGTAIAHWVQEQLEAGRVSSLSGKDLIDTRLVSQEAKAGDGLAREALRRAGYYLGIGIASFLHIFNPTAVIIGGGVSQSGPLLFDPLREILREVVLTPDYLEDLTLTTAALGDQSGLMGALALARSIDPANEDRPVLNLQIE
jgi:glucokinase